MCHRALIDLIQTKILPNNLDRILFCKMLKPRPARATSCKHKTCGERIVHRRCEKALCKNDITP